MLGWFTMGCYLGGILSLSYLIGLFNGRFRIFLAELFEDYIYGEALQEVIDFNPNHDTTQELIGVLLVISLMSIFIALIIMLGSFILSYILIAAIMLVVPLYFIVTKEK